MADNQTKTSDNQTESEYAGDSWADVPKKGKGKYAWTDTGPGELEDEWKSAYYKHFIEGFGTDYADRTNPFQLRASRIMTDSPTLPGWDTPRSDTKYRPKPTSKDLAAWGITEREHPLGLWSYSLDPSAKEKSGLIDIERTGPEGVSSQPLEGEYLTPEEIRAAEDYDTSALDHDLAAEVEASGDMSHPISGAGIMSHMPEEQIAEIAALSDIPYDAVEKIVEKNSGPEMMSLDEQNKDNARRYELEQAKDFERIIALRQQYRALKEEEIKLKKGQESIILESNLKQQAHLTAADERAGEIKTAREAMWEKWKDENKKGTALSNKLLEYAGIKVLDGGKVVDIDDGMGGWEIFKKASLAVGAVIAAGATVVGQAALSSEGVAMPNVFMPLILKAIDADIASMRREKAGFVDDAGHLVRYTQEMRSIFSTERETLNHMQTAGLKYTKNMIARERERLKLNLEGSGTKAEALNLIENALQREIVKKQLDEAVQQRTKIEQMVQAGVETRGSAATLELSRSNLDNARLKAVQLRRKLYGTKDDKLTAAESQVTNQRITTLEPIARLKERLSKLFIQTASHGTFEGTNVHEWIAMKASDFWPKLARTYPTKEIGWTEIAQIKKELRSLQRVTAKRMEGRLTGPDWQFYEKNLGIGPAEAGDDWTTSILTIIDTLSRVEYQEKLKILTSLTSLTPQGQARWDLKYRTITDRTLADVMNKFEKSINQDMLKGGHFVPFDVGVVEIPLTGTKLNDKVLQNAVNGWKRLVVSPDSNERSEVFQIKKKMEEDEKRNRKPLLTFEDLVQVPTHEGKPAYLPKEFAERWKRFAHYVLAKTNGKVNLMLRGHRSGGRNDEMTQSLREDNYRPARRGGHTAHGGFRNFDVYLGKGNPYDSPIYKAMVMYGPAAGIVRDHDLETDTEKSLGRKPYYGAWHFQFLDLKSSPKEKRG